MAVTARRLGNRLAFAGFLFLLMVPTLFFFYWMISLSLKTDVTTWPTRRSSFRTA